MAGGIAHDDDAHAAVFGDPEQGFPQGRYIQLCGRVVAAQIVVGRAGDGQVHAALGKLGQQRQAVTRQETILAQETIIGQQFPLLQFPLLQFPLFRIPAWRKRPS